MVEPEQQYRRGMVVVAHADDAEWGCSGTVAKWCADGWEVVYVLCTDGSKGSDDLEMTSQDLVKTREQGAGTEQRGFFGPRGRYASTHIGTAPGHCPGDSALPARCADLHGALP